MNIIETFNLGKKYGNYDVLKDVSMHVEKGDIYGFVGKNGAGKTTLIRILCGLQRPSSGEYSLYYAPYDSINMSTLRKKMGAIIESPALYLDDTARGNLRYQFELLGNTNYEEIDEILDLVGLGDTQNKKVKDFSLGMRERLAIGLTLVGHPDLIILDEPINGLDPQGIIEVRELILKLNKEEGITFLISSHILDELAKMATRYGFIKDGTLIKEVTQEELLKECRKSIIIETSNLRASIVVYDKLGYEYKTLNDNEVEIFSDININKLVINLDNAGIDVKKIKENDENLETYFMKLLGGGNNA